MKLTPSALLISMATLALSTVLPRQGETMCRMGIFQESGQLPVGIITFGCEPTKIENDQECERLAKFMPVLNDVIEVSPAVTGLGKNVTVGLFEEYQYGYVKYGNQDLNFQFVCDIGGVLGDAATSGTVEHVLCPFRCSKKEA